jgi:hypothetical protein
VGMTRNHKMTRNFLEMTRIDGKGKGKLQEPETTGSTMTSVGKRRH